MIKFDYLPYEPLRITSPFGRRKTGILGASTDHKGVDLGADKSRYRGNTDGGSVRAVLPYVVSESYYNKFRGWVVLLNHGKGIQTLYQHLKEKGMPSGVHGNAGNIIGTMGNTGTGAQLHLHFELRVNGVPIDPEPSLREVDEREADMTKQEVIEIMNELDPIYRTLNDIPDWGRETIRTFIADGKIKPDNGVINLRLSMLRIIVILSR